MVSRKIAIVLWLLLTIGVFGQPAFGYVFIETTVFGPKTYIRGTGEPQTFVDTFPVFNPDGEFRLRVINGEWGGDKRIEDAVSSARIFVNGVEIVTTSDFNKTVATIDDSVQEIFSENIVEVWMASAPESKLIVEIIGSDQDTIPPVIEVTSPTDGAFLNTAQPLLEATYYDDWMGIDASSFSGVLDGTDITSMFTVDEASASYQIESGNALSEGTHEFSASISDLLGNSATATSTFLVDVTPPSVSVDYPPDGQTIAENTPLIQISYSDNLSGVNVSTLVIEINGTDFTSSFTIVSSGASYQTVAGDLLDGDNEITVSVSDSAGNVATAASNFTIEQFRAIATAYPTEGPAPLTVVFTQAGTDPTSTIENYRWDFDDNGSWDTYNQVARQYTHTYHLSGTYNAILRVQNSRGEYAYDTVVITVTPTPPTATATAVPSNGEVPLTVSFYGSGSDPDGYITLHEWDFDGDGIYDWSSPSSGNTSWEYLDVGTYAAIYRVTDNSGLTATAAPILTEVRAGPPGSPTASGSANPSSGEAPLTVNFTGVGTDPEGVITLYEWDFDGDGIYDWSSPTTGNTSYPYDIPGVYYPAFRVTDGDGFTAVDYISVSVGLGVNLVIPDDTFDPYSSETAIIRTTITAPIPVNVLIKTEEGDVIRTLVANETRTAGTHDDIWDGTDDLGYIVNDGPYYAVLEYYLEGQWITYDLTHSTGGSQYYPYRQSIGYGRVIHPFNDELLDIHFSLARASAVTCFLGYLWGPDIRIRTIVYQEPYPAGSHVLWWDGLNDEGNVAIVPPGITLVPGMFGYTLPDNAIFLTGGAPIVSNVRANPNVLSHFDESYGATEGRRVTVMYTLSEPSTVTLKVMEPTSGSIVRSVSQSGVPSGDNVFYWDGLNQEGSSVSGDMYQIGIVAIDTEGNQSAYRYTLIRTIF